MMPILFSPSHSTRNNPPGIVTLMREIERAEVVIQSRIGGIPEQNEQNSQPCSIGSRGYREAILGGEKGF